VLGIIVCILFGLTLPMSAAQILWINLVTEISLGLALAFEPAEPGVMDRPPRDAAAPLVSGFMLWRIVLVSIVFAGVSLGLLQSTLARGGSLEEARTLVLNAVVAMEIGYLFSVRFLARASLTWRGAMGTPAVLGAVGFLVLAQLVITYVPVMNRLFGTAPLDVGQLALATVVGAALMLLLEGEKAVLRHAWPQLAIRA
jgi:magnesium-transporting ATPase (P-type)